MIDTDSNVTAQRLRPINVSDRVGTEPTPAASRATTVLLNSTPEISHRMGDRPTTWNDGRPLENSTGDDLAMTLIIVHH